MYPLLVGEWRVSEWGVAQVQGEILHIKSVVFKVMNLYLQLCLYTHNYDFISHNDDILLTTVTLSV